METAVKRLAVLATLGMFLVLIMGSTVTDTGSGEGCGRSWPLCHGEFIPEYAVETAVEYSHRAVTGVEGILIVAVGIGSLMLHRGRREVKVLVALMVGSLLLQAGMGASAVMNPQDSTILALHFGISLVCFASTALVLRLLYEPRNVASARVVRVPLGYRWLAWGTLLFAIGVAYIGAYMRHSGNELACTTWPGCNGAVIPDLSGPEGVAFAHRLAAMISGFMVAALTLWSARFGPEGRSLHLVNLAALGLVVLQALSGAAVVLDRLSLWSTLTHAGLMALLFTCLADGCYRLIPHTHSVPDHHPVRQGAPLTAR